MTKTIATTLLIATAALIAAPASAAPLTVHVTGVSDAGGQLYVSVQRADQFMRQEGVAGQIVPTPAAGDHSFSYDVPEGEYAVTIWHDDNGNGAFDMGADRMPEDGWAMVNGSQLRGEPAFDQVKTVVGADGTSITLPMIYGRGE